MFISYAILTHNEGFYIENLLTKLISHINKASLKEESEIVILDDYSKDAATQMILRRFLINEPNIKLSHRKHNGNFSDQKNALNKLCTGKWIFNLDADEWAPDYLLSIIPKIIEINSEVDAFWIPRINVVDGLTESHVKEWNWKITTLDGLRRERKINLESDEYAFLKLNNLIEYEQEGVVCYNPPVVMWPDYQLRLYKNNDDIKWIKPVHEQIVGYKKVSHFPANPDFAICHFKDIKRQEEQNSFYDRIQKNS